MPAPPTHTYRAGHGPASSWASAEIRQASRRRSSSWASLRRRNLCRIGVGATRPRAADPVRDQPSSGGPRRRAPGVPQWDAGRRGRRWPPLHADTPEASPPADPKDGQYRRRNAPRRLPSPNGTLSRPQRQDPWVAQTARSVPLRAVGQQQGDGIGLVEAGQIEEVTVLAKRPLAIGVVGHQRRGWDHRGSGTELLDEALATRLMDALIEDGHPASPETVLQDGSWESGRADTMGLGTAHALRPAGAAARSWWSCWVRLCARGRGSPADGESDRVHELAARSRPLPGARRLAKLRQKLGRTLSVLVIANNGFNIFGSLMLGAMPPGCLNNGASAAWPYRCSRSVSPCW